MYTAYLGFHNDNNCSLCKSVANEKKEVLCIGCGQSFYLFLSKGCRSRKGGSGNLRPWHRNHLPSVKQEYKVIAQRSEKFCYRCDWINRNHQYNTDQPFLLLQRENTKRENQWRLIIISASSCPKDWFNFNPVNFHNCQDHLRCHNMLILWFNWMT
jgi:hypothetical protein